MSQKETSVVVSIKLREVEPDRPFRTTTLEVPEVAYTIVAEYMKRMLPPEAWMLHIEINASAVGHLPKPPPVAVEYTETPVPPETAT